jgi:hypothetical protein
MLPRRYAALVCEDGFSVSIQAGERSYCSPRNDIGPYTAVELGFPNEEDPLIIPWAEDGSDLKGTVYGYVPVDIVLEMITNHGGIKSGELPPMEYATWDGQL